MYTLDNSALRNAPWITVVGCGGTGGFVAEGICRLFQGRDVALVLVDHDRVEPHNILRQNFYEKDVGGFKSQVLAERLSVDFGMTVGYSVYPFQEYNKDRYRLQYPGLDRYGGGMMIGCTDNAAARKAMAGALPGSPDVWLVDAGNDTNWGQVLIGNVGALVYDRRVSAFVDDTCYLLPAPTVQRPDLLTAVLTAPPRWTLLTRTPRSTR